MRCAAVLVMFALLFGAAPARADDSSSILNLFRHKSDDKPVKKHVRRKAVPVKPNETKAADAKPVEAKPAEAKPVETKPAAVKSANAKAAAIKPANAAVAKLTAPKATEAKGDSLTDVFAGIPRGERQKIQAALLWSGDDTGATANDDPMLMAIKNYQKRNKAKVTGVLSPSERAALVAAAKTHEDEFGWSVVVDPATGIRIGLPIKLVPIARDAARGTRWSSAHGEVQIETFRIKDANLKLAALFEREKKEPGTRRVSSSALHDDGFFVSGMQGLKNFSVRARQRNGEVRGFTMSYDQAMEGIVAPVLAAMGAAFSPFPEHSAPYAALAKSVEYGTGLVVSAQGHIVTDRKLTEGCQVIVAAGLGSADRMADDKDHGLALLRVYGQPKMSPLALTYDAAKSGDEPRYFTLVGIPDPKEQDGRRKLTEVKARLTGGAGIELRQPVPMAGFSGAAALDAKGEFLGMMEMGTAVFASIEPSAPPVRLVSAQIIHAFLAAHRVPMAQTQAGDARSAVVRIICVRK